MNTQFFFFTALVFHITGFTMMAGASLVDFIITGQFWKQYAADKSKAMVINQAMTKIVALFGIGILFILTSGVGMMALSHGIFGEQLWFRIKMGLVLLIIINGLAIGRRLGTKLSNLLKQQTLTEQMEVAALKIKKKLYCFHLSQLLLFLIIFVLSAFKFN